MRPKIEGKAESFAKEFFKRKTILRIRCETKQDLINKHAIILYEHLMFKNINKIGRLNISFASKIEKLVNELKLDKKQIQIILDLSNKIKIPLDIMSSRATEIRRLELKIRRLSDIKIETVNEKFKDNTVLCSDSNYEKLRIHFQIRPSFEQRQELIDSGFILSSSDLAWTIKQTIANISIAKNIITKYL